MPLGNKGVLERRGETQVHPAELLTASVEMLAEWLLEVAVLEQEEAEEEVEPVVPYLFI
jgi:hypothetical protein